MNRFILLLTFAMFLAESFASGSQPADISCKFAKGFSSSYEETNDFSFQDYPWLLIAALPDGYSVTVGGIAYGDDYSGTEPSQIKKTQISPNEVLFENTNQSEKWTIRITGNTALFSAHLDSSKQEFTHVASFICQ